MKCFEKLNSYLKKKILFIYLFLERGREEERERNINVWLPLMHPVLGTWPTTQACALTGNRTSNPLVWSLALSPVHHTRQGTIIFNLCKLKWKWTCFSWCSYFLNKKITREIISLTILLHDEIAYGWSSGGKIVLNHTAICLSCLWPSISWIQLFKI